MGIGVGRHVRNVTKPFVPDHTTEKELTGGYGEYADYKRASVIAQERRRAWARFGNSTGVELLDLFPTDQEYKEEFDAEISCWKSLPRMRYESRQIDRENEIAEMNHQKQIDIAMAKMPEKILKLTSKRNK